VTTAGAAGAAGSVDVREVEVAVADVVLRSTTGGTGPAVVTLHHSFGNGGWTALHDDLARDHEVHSLDLPGFDRSDRPEWARDTRDLAILVGHWVQRAGLGSAVVVGSGFGGWVAAHLATMRPEVMSRLVLVGAAGLLPADGRILDQFLIAHSEYARAAFHDDAVYGAVFGTELTDELLLRFDGNREMTTRVAWKPYMYDRRLPALLAEVVVPTLVVWGEHDAVVPPECGRRYAELIPGARLEVVAGAGHAVDLERPELLAELVRTHATS
jgi:pimeloyl-ACP methyl ester carboxylesterase